MAKRILIADDSVNTRGILKFMLQNAGFELVEAENGEEALTKADASAPDLIVLDGMMPKLSGFDACRYLKENPRTKSIPVILLTAVPQMDPTRDWKKEAPADRFMAKPFQMRDLLAAIEGLLGITLASETQVRRKAGMDSSPQGTVIRQKAAN